MIVWLTGLPSAGKTTLAQLVVSELRLLRRMSALLDGDDLRWRLWPELGFSKEDRDANVERLGYVARLLSGQGVIAVVAAVSPYRTTREVVRRLCNEPFIEVAVVCPIETCISRDVKGLYAKALRGEIKGMTGLDDPYEAPVDPEVVVHTDTESIVECASKIMDAVK